ncbi:hypothetical protein BFN67_05075 [Pseudaminobacter manganicus]|uniref:Autotransporter domain-containing protein n=1 Tax=Manganibacter manganicus TaxID=1873176 RepID=A0A1V8RLZ1_9HYPH|nr:hypothetical protein BFN67_05075 [Pseudaminobacter manganicus]
MTALALAGALSVPGLILAPTSVYAAGGAGGAAYRDDPSAPGGAGGVNAGDVGEKGQTRSGGGINPKLATGSGGGGGGAAAAGGDGGDNGHGTAGSAGGAAGAAPGEDGQDGKMAPNGTGAGGGGGGAHGVQGASIEISEGETVKGGAGGAGGEAAGTTRGGGAGGGGSGGYGAQVDAGAASNAGTAQGGNGGLGGGHEGGGFITNAGSGGDGGAGIGLSDGASVVNTGDAIGGTGGEGGQTLTGIGGGGGNGGAGILGGDHVAIVNQGLATGGAGARNGPGVRVTGANGNGGHGIFVGENAHITNQDSGSIIGGVGAAGEGLGGNGGAGIRAFDTVTIVNQDSATITGGVGADAGAFSEAGNGGAGVTASGNLDNSATISGGVGGTGWDGISSGAGGAGVDSTALTILNTGVISGGAGGAAATTGISIVGAGGVGVTGSDLTVINSGTIAGGLADNGTGTQAAAVDFTGGVNRLELRTGYVFNGDIIANGAQDTLVLGGSSSDDVFDTGLIGDAAQYRGFDAFEKTGTGTWTLTGATTAATPWTLVDGTLSISADNQLGDPSQPVTFDGGTLENTAAFDTTRNVTVDAGGGTFQTDADLGVSGIISGVGGLSKTGAGTLALSGANTYTGGTTIVDGVIEASRADGNGVIDALGSGLITLAGGTLRSTLNAASTLNSYLIAAGTTGTITTASGTILYINGTRGQSFDVDGNVVFGSAIDTGTIFFQPAGVHLGADRTSEVLIAGGTLVAGNNTFADYLSWNSKAIKVDTAATLDLGSFSTNIWNLQDGPTGGGTVDWQSALGIATGNFSGILAGSNGLFKLLPGTLTLSGTNTYTGGTRLFDGVLSISSDVNLGDASGDVTFDGGTLENTAAFTTARNFTVDGGGGTFQTDADLTVNGLISGNGSLTKTGASTLTLEGDGSGFAGQTDVVGGTLLVGGSAGSATMLGGVLDVLSGGRLGGHGTVGTTTLHSGGVIAPGASIGTLTVNGDFIGDGGVLEIETVLGDDSSDTDLLVVTGNTSGNAAVEIINRGGTGAATVEGIKIVDVGGASDATFSLLGDYIMNGEQAVVVGAYGYTLHKNGVSTPDDGDWYLRSGLIDPGGPTDPADPVFQPGAPIYEVYGQLLQGLNGVSTLRQRVGNRYWTGAGNGSVAQGDGPGTVEAEPMPSAGGGVAMDARGIWARIEGAHGHYEPKSSTGSADYDLDTFKMETGIDGQFYKSEAGRLIGGVTVHYGHASADISSPYGTGSIDTDGYGLGATLTWYGQNGFYLDGQARATWYDSDLTSDTLGRRLADGNDGFGYAFSAETGKRIDLNANWTLTPQAQLVYSSVDFDSFTDPFGAGVTLDSGDSLRGRLGLAASYESAWLGDTGKISRSHVYGIANLYHEFLDGSVTDVAGIKFSNENERTWGGIGAGGSYNWNDDKYALYGEVSLNTSLSNFADSYTLNGTAGFRVRF